jgi:hypothetical protein
VQLNTAIAIWVVEEHSLAPRRPGCAAQVLEEKSTDYTIEEL